MPMDVEFSNVTITIKAETPEEAYEKLGKLLVDGVEIWQSDTFRVWDEGAEDWTDDQDTSVLWDDEEDDEDETGEDTNVEVPATDHDTEEG